MGAARQGHPAGRARPGWDGTAWLQARRPTSYLGVGWWQRGTSWGWGECPRQWSPPLTSQQPSVPPSALLLPAKVMLTVALEQGSVSPPHPCYQAT